MTPTYSTLPMPDMPDAWHDKNIRAALRRIFDAAIHSAQPARVLARHLPSPPKGQCVVVGAGKAAAAMAAALEQAWPDVPLRGVVVTRDGHIATTSRIRVMEAAHPVPDSRSEDAARAILHEVRGLGPDDLVIALISGGGSALMELPAPGLTLADMRALNQELLHCGADIGDMNLVRRHLSDIKGGRLARACAPARVLTLAISDVPGDDPLTIASGPTVPDPTTPADALAVLRRRDITVTPQILDALMRPLPPCGQEAANPDNRFVLIATPMMALEAAAQEARTLGLTPLILGDALEGESRDAAIVMAGIAQSARHHGVPVAGPAVLLSGGEMTVSLRAGDGPPGRGGRNTEFLLSLALALQEHDGIWAIAGDSDGIDGTEDAAGAIVTPDTLSRARAQALDPREFLRRHDSYSLFDATGDLVRTGPTLTNVNDIRAIMVSETV